MNKAFEEILERLEELIEKSYSSAAEGNPNARIKNRAYHKVKQIIYEVLQKYKEDIKYNLAEMYAKNMVDYGVDVTKEWQTATQQSYALEKAYIRGRQYEIDRFNKSRKECNSGWIACNERLPEEYTVLCCDKYGEMIVGHPYFDEISKLYYIAESDNEIMYNCVAWQPLPEPFKECD